MGLFVLMLSVPRSVHSESDQQWLGFPDSLAGGAAWLGLQTVLILTGMLDVAGNEGVCELEIALSQCLVVPWWIAVGGGVEGQGSLWEAHLWGEGGGVGLDGRRRRRRREGGGGIAKTACGDKEVGHPLLSSFHLLCFKKCMRRERSTKTCLQSKPTGITSQE